MERLLAGEVVPVCSVAAAKQERPWWGGAGRCGQNLTSGSTVEGEEFLLEKAISQERLTFPSHGRAGPLPCLESGLGTWAPELQRT